MSTTENSDDTNDFHIPNQTNSVAQKNLCKKIKPKDKQCDFASGRHIVAVRAIILRQALKNFMHFRPSNAFYKNARKMA